MAKTMQILKLTHGGINYHVVLHVYDGTNPYWVYQDTWNCTSHGWSHKLVVKYADLVSVMYYLYTRVDRFVQ